MPRFRVEQVHCEPKEIVMKMRSCMAFAATLVSVLWASSAFAERETVTVTGPNRALLHSGFFAFGVPYAASLVVATTSEHQGDRNLYLPVVGPWMDFADRGSCGGLGGTPCDKETAYKVLLVADGIFQGVGALDIVGAFVFPETRTIAAGNEPRLVVAPLYTGGSGYGVSALGKF
jgi:hypothetical protein